MEIASSFVLPLPPDEAYRALLDIERVAPCVPGGELGPREGDDTYPAKMTVKLGPMRLVYTGTLRVAGHEDRSRRAVLRVNARAGPTAPSPPPLPALGSPITYPYDPAFLECFRRTERKVAQILQTSNDVVLMQGEAVLGLEAAARGLVRPGAQALNLVSGIFGKGMGYWLRDFGAEVHEIEVAYNDAVDPTEVERFLAGHPGIEVVAVVHSETPSGTCNPVDAIGKIAHGHGAV